MPTERFYHLSTEKKKLIREAAVEEFSRVSIEKASINKIVQNADISRGSFYTYFKDKEDVLQYILEDLIRQVIAVCKEVLIESKGDFWKLTDRLLEYILTISEQNRKMALKQTAVGRQMVAKILTERCLGGIDSANIAIWQAELYRMTDCSRLKVENFEDFQTLFSVCIYNIMATIEDVCHEGGDRDRGIRAFHKRLYVIKYGAVRKEASNS